MRLRNRFVGGALAVATVLAPATGLASSHREAPFITKNPKVDGTDFYMFNSYESGRSGFVTLIANYLPLQDAYGGPNYFGLDPAAIYEIHIDNDGDAKEDITFQFDFDTTLANGGVSLNVGPSGQTKSVSVPFVAVGPITAADESARNVIDTYTVNIIRGARRTGTAMPITQTGTGSSRFKKPLDYIGGKTIANYAAYANAHIYSIDIPGCSTPGAKLFVGQRKEGFAVNLGQIFDLVNLDTSGNNGRANVVGAQDQGFNTVNGKNITSLALEVPKACLTANASTPIIGGWTTASVRQARVINPTGTFDTPSREGGPWVQVSRLGMVLVNEVVIGLKDKDKFNGSEPKDDGQFADYVTNPTLPEVLELLFGSIGVRAPDLFPRVDLVTAFLQGVPNVNANGSLAEMVRLNTAVPATPAAQQQSLGAALCFDASTSSQNAQLNLNHAGCDPAGFPNGRRPGDDTVDIAIRVAMGYLVNTTAAPAGQLPYVDGAFYAPTSFQTAFPYLNTPTPGAP